mgnify:CR=1 FL=1
MRLLVVVVKYSGYGNFLFCFERQITNYYQNRIHTLVQNHWCEILLDMGINELKPLP